VLPVPEEEVVPGTICYLNTDLDLTSPSDLTALAAAFEARGLRSLHVACGEDAQWYATFENAGRQTDPEQDIAAMVAVVESLGEPHRSAWRGCTRREFNIGYDCGDEPWAFNQGLSCALLGRMADVGASLRITLYPYREQGSAEVGNPAEPPRE
jgi:hypothetical protein